MLVWNVYISNFNSRKMEPFNVFNHASFMEDCRKNYKKNKDDREAFFAKMKTDLMYYYWSKCEWEIVLGHWPSKENDRDIRIDVFDQICLNWDRFCDYVWGHRSEFKPQKKGIRRIQNGSKTITKLPEMQ